MGNLAENLAGKFIVLDGPDGSGKTTQLRLLAEHLTAGGADVEVVMDPGTTKIGQKIRALLLDRDNGEIGPLCETMLFMASRAQLVAEKVRPALAAGKVVLCDRFVSATIAYQGAAGVDCGLILNLGDMAIDGVWPDLTVILDVPVDEGMKRLGVTRDRLKRPADEEMQKAGAKRGKPNGRRPAREQLSLFGDRMEYRSPRYHERVRAIFRELGGDYPGEVRHVDATETEREVFERLIQIITREFGPV